VLKLKNTSIRNKLLGSFLLVALLPASFLLVEYPLLQWRFYLIESCIVILSIMLAFVPANTILKNLRKLQNAAGEIAHGNFKVRVDIDSADEIGQLAQAFNRMADELMNTNTSIQTLDDQMSQRQEVEHKLLRLNEDLCAVVDRLDESNRELQHLTHMTSHDLSEPLRKICCFGRLIEESAKSKLDEDERENLWFMIDAADRMLERIDGIRAYSDIVGEAWPSECVDLKRVIDELTETEFSAVIKSKDALITICEPLPKVNANHSQVLLLLRHLMSNAFEYSRQGVRPTIRISAARQQDNMVRVDIEDNGIGITKIDFKVIFAMFKRLHPQQKHKGAGIGLSLCKKIIERHGGNIGVTSEPGKGATFWFTLPAAQSQYKKQNKSQSTTAAG